MKTPTLRTGQAWNNEEGFTFLEIFVVLVIMSIMMALVIPSFNRMFASVEGAREGGKVLRLLEKARAEAILRAEPVEITFITNGLCIFQLKDKVVEYEDLRMTVSLPSTEEDTADEDEDEETVEEGKIVQVFNPDGTAKIGQLTFVTNEGWYIIYNFNLVSGQIEMERRASL